MTDLPSMSPLAQQNDAFRRGASDLEGHCVHTAAIAGYGADVVQSIWDMVRAFDEFTPENDAHGEHDFGSFLHPIAGAVYWKIDYYDLDYVYGAENPADPSQTRRVLTIMLDSDC